MRSTRAAKRLYSAPGHAAQEYAVPPARYAFSMLLLPLQAGAGASAGDAAEAAWRQHR